MRNVNKYGAGPLRWNKIRLVLGDATTTGINQEPWKNAYNNWGRSGISSRVKAAVMDPVTEDLKQRTAR